MEGHTSKRRRIERTERPLAGDLNVKPVEEHSRNMGSERDITVISKPILPAPATRPQGRHIHGSTGSRQEIPSKIHARQLFPTQAAQPAAGSVPTMLAVAIDNGNGIVSEIAVPVGAKSVWVAGYGELDMGNGASVPTWVAPGLAPTNTVVNPGVVTPEAAVAASKARDQALHTQQAIAKQLNVVPQAQNDVPTASSSPPSMKTNDDPAPALSNSPAAQPAKSEQASIAINVPESRSQQVLSSPPTPNPATPQSSASSAASYFSSSPAALPTAASSPVTRAPTPSQISNSNIAQLPASNNSTLLATNSVSSTAAASSSISSLGFGASGLSSSVSLQSAASQASLLSMESMTALASATRNPSGFMTSTVNSQSYSSETGSSQFPASTSALGSSLSNSFQSTSHSATVSLPSSSASGTAFGVGGIGGAGNTAAAASPTSSAGGGSGGDSTPPTPVLVGGIVGGVAGAAMILFALLLLFRWRRGRIGQRRNISPPIPQTLGHAGVPGAGTMTQRSSSTPIAAAGFFGRLRPVSSQTATTADTAPSERGFQKLSGRKLPSVLTSGGDGYGGTAAGISAAGASAAIATEGVTPRSAGTANAGAGSSSWATASSSTERTGPASRGRGITHNPEPLAAPPPLKRPSPPHSLSGSSFYRDSRGFYGGTGADESTQGANDSLSSPSNSPPYPTPLSLAGMGKPSNSPSQPLTFRPGPARTPVINEPATIPIRTPSRAKPPTTRPMRATPSPQNPFRDGVGRSLSSQDGSRGSRFREDTTPP